MAAPVAPSASTAPPLNMGVRVQLSVMMFLQFAVWGSWFTVFGNRLAALGLGDYVGSMYGTMALGSIFAPLIVGQIADRYFASEKLMAILHLAGAGLLFWMSQFQPVVGLDSAAIRAQSWVFYAIALGYALLYSPTLALANSVAFTHVPDGQRDFPGLRVFGTIGWILVGLTVGKVVSLFVPDPATSNAPFLLAAGLSAVLGVYSFFLPHTPPTGKAGDALPFLRAVKLLKDPSFAVFFGASFLITIVLAFYYNYTGLFIGDHHKAADVASTMTIGQLAEMLILPLLPLFLIRFGMKTVLALGMLCWGVRYLLFALAPVNELGWALVLLGIALHGFCFDFFFAAGFIHVDKEAPADIRGSGQALFTFLTYGVGMWLGSEFSNRIFGTFTTEQKTDVTAQTMRVTEWFADRGWVSREFVSSTPGIVKETDWQNFWLVPAAGVLVAFLIFVLFFRMHKRTTTVQMGDSKEEYKQAA
jgi:nucleoside transporter